MSNQSPTANSNHQFPVEPFTESSTSERPREAAPEEQPDERESTAERPRLETDDTEDYDEFDEGEEESNRTRRSRPFQH